MSGFFHASPDGWGKTRMGAVSLAALLLASPRLARSHDALGFCVQHTVRLTVSAQHIDVAVDLTFFEKWSASERAVMDADGNGAITRAEQDAYLKRIGPRLGKQMKLFVAGRELPLAPLYEPELDLLGNHCVGPAHHRLHLLLFAPTPAGLRAGDAFLIEDQLWPKAEMLVTPRAEGRDGCRLASEHRADTALLPKKRGQQPRISFKCLQPPSSKSAAPGAALDTSRRRAGVAAASVRSPGQTQECATMRTAL